MEEFEEMQKESDELRVYYIGPSRSALAGCLLCEPEPTICGASLLRGRPMEEVCPRTSKDETGLSFCNYPPARLEKTALVSTGSRVQKASRGLEVVWAS